MFQSEIDQEFDILQQSISHQEEENPEKECLIDTTVEEQYKQQDEAIFPLLTEEGSGKETVEGTQKPILQPIPINLNPSATAQPQNSPLPVYILPTPAPHSKPEAPAPKAHASPSLLVQNIRKLVAIVRASAATSKTQAAAYIAWHSDWFGCWFGFGAPEPRHF